MDQHALSDKIPIRHDFEAPFEQSILTYYTDGSRKDGMTSIGIYGPCVRYYEALSASTTIFQAEMLAINLCTRICWLSTKCKLTLMWVSDHTGVDGNEEARLFLS
jgi:hypothetical protein